ncbi:NUDIX hydrolase [Roseibium sp. RKSG952]|uniref:NUDIX hydrolase n=1 Tax=Roseibium sp. RKSG952 TaxID=2529384 RepID=UPI0012BCA6B3|nr:NUDIX hydrolase [Roseibium sp. RKSG952]MTI00529.1 NUDIX hydrolase [Roseibium sp. RKSG952]
MAKKLRKIWDEVARPLFLRPRRVQFAALCTRKAGDRDDVLLITSRDTGRWIIPKGWPIDGLDGSETALQEAWEEAGVRVADAEKEPMGHYTYDKVLKDGTAEPVLTSVYHVRVAELSDKYPEAHQRERVWVSPDVAAERVQEPELRDLLLQM